MRTAVGWYAIVVGVLMLGWWATAVRGGALRRGDRTRVELLLHLGAEVLSALVLLVGGALVLASATPAVLLVGLGMLLYTVIQSPGYMAARGERGAVVMFVVLGVLTVAAIVALVVEGVG